MSISDFDQKIPLIQLKGDPLENFYQLGLKDRADHDVILGHIMGLLKTPWKIVDKLAHGALQLSVDQVLPKHPEMKKRLDAYSEGLQIPTKHLATALLIPEIMSCLSKWIPGVTMKPLGCSSLFQWDEKNEGPIHYRILDFPLLGSYDLHERAVQYQFKNRPTMFSYGATGLPYPSLTTMTSAGVTLALHQKFTDVFNAQGTPIFELIYDMLNKVSTAKEAKDYLLKSSSITTWALYMSFKDGTVLCADIMGDDIYFNEYQLSDKKFLYVNNMLENPSLNMQDYRPFGFQSYCDMRNVKADRLIKNLVEKNIRDEDKVLKAFCSPQEKKGDNASEWNLDIITPSSLQISSFNVAKQTSDYVLGRAPKYFQGPLSHFENVFSNPDQTVNTKGKPVDEKFQEGMQHYIRAQGSFDFGKIHEAYHHIQLAYDDLAGWPEQSIARFFQLTFHYLHEPDKKLYPQILQDFKSLLPVLPPNLQDHGKLMIARLEKILGKVLSISENDIQSTPLKRVYHFDKNLPTLVLAKISRSLTFPRLDTMDLVYGYVRS